MLTKAIMWRMERQTSLAPCNVHRRAILRAGLPSGRESTASATPSATASALFATILRAGWTDGRAGDGGGDGGGGAEGRVGRVARAEMGPDIVVKAMSEQTILEALDKAVGMIEKVVPRRLSSAAY